MKSHTKLLLAAAASVGLAGLTSPAQGARLLYYNFQDGTDATITNTGTTGTAGTLTSLVGGAPDPARHSFVPGFSGTIAGIGPVNTGTALRLTPGSNNNSGDDVFVQTNLTAPQLAASSGTYTMMAWVNVTDFNNDDTTGNNDNMIFGQVVGGGNPPTNDQYLHNGFRGNRIHQGHWGNDEERTGPDLPENQWMHVAYVYENNEQRQYLNGVEATTADADAEGPLLNLNNITIGKTQGNNGNLNGIIDEVKMFDTALTPAQIIQEAAIPEPASVGLLALGGLGLLCRRRRRA